VTQSKCSRFTTLVAPAAEACYSHNSNDIIYTRPLRSFFLPMSNLFNPFYWALIGPLATVRGALSHSQYTGFFSVVICPVGFPSGLPFNSPSSRAHISPPPLLRSYRLLVHVVFSLRVPSCTCPSLNPSLTLRCDPGWLNQLYCSV
jgi:hypothetical protein